MKNVSPYNVTIALLLVVLMVVLLFVNVSFIRSYNKTNQITQNTVTEIQNNVLQLKDELSTVRNSQSDMSDRIRSVEERQTDLETRLEEESEQSNVRMILPVATPEEIRREEAEREAEKRMRESVDALLERMSFVEEAMQTDRERMQEALRELEAKIKVTIDYAQDNRLQIEKIVSEAENARERLEEVRAGIERLDRENRTMHYNYDAVLDLRLEEGENTTTEADTPEEAENEAEEGIIGEAENCETERMVNPEETEEMTGNTERARKKFFLIRFFQWIGNLF